MDVRKRQKRLLRKVARSRKLRGPRSMSKPIRSMSPKQLVKLAAESPVHEALVPSTLFEAGIGTVILSRRLPKDMLAASCFLLDVWCLGAKNAFFGRLSEDEYERLVEQCEEHGRFEREKPETVRKLVESSVAYARDLGFAPHPDYRLAHRIFGEIDPRESLATFQFGLNGRPHYVAGPYDSPADVSRVLRTLELRLGPGNFEYTVPVTPPAAAGNRRRIVPLF